MLIFNACLGTHSSHRSRLGLFFVEGAVAIFGNLPLQLLFNLLFIVFYTEYLCEDKFSHPYIMPLAIQSF
jgi:hypothetical protein